VQEKLAKRQTKKALAKEFPCWPYRLSLPLFFAEQ
jgi:hypothetical protein